MISLPVILASASPRRRRLMASFPWRVTVRPSGAREPARRRGERSAAYAARLALLKARAVARRVGAGLVLGADTIVVHRGVIYGKPRSVEEARRTLATLSGRWHRVYTGVALVARPGGRAWRMSAVTRVKMRVLSPERIARESRRHLDKAGAYAAQARGNPFVAGYRGDADTVVGLPRRGVRALLEKARRAGFIPVRKAS